MNTQGKARLVGTRMTVAEGMKSVLMWIGLP
jgi:hypothetical protein